MTPDLDRISTRPGRGAAGLRWPALAAVVWAADEATKSLVAGWPAGRVVRVGGFARIQVVHNGGGPFALWPGGADVFTVLSVVGVVAIAALARSVSRTGAALAVAAMAGGALGNLTDRLVRSPGGGRGRVVDWLQVAGYPHTFNLADVALRAGAVGLVVLTLMKRRAGAAPGPLPSSSPDPARR